MLRWRSDEALKIYARINDSQYTAWLAKAAHAEVTSVRSHTALREAMTAAQLGPDATAGFQCEWLRRAAGAHVTRDLVERAPTHTADEAVEQITGDLAGMTRIAEEDAAAS